MDAFGWMEGFSPVVQALFGTLFTWSLTALGAAAVFFLKSPKRRLLDSMLGFAGGVMIAASFWSLLAPALEMAHNDPMPSWMPAYVPAGVGFMAGGIFLWGVDKILPHIHPGLKSASPEGIKTSWQRSTLLVLAITLHNVPEGLAVGVAFGAVAAGYPSATLAGAAALALGIGIQNFPEGFSVSVPLRREGISRLRSFWYGQLSGVVEPVAGVAGAFLVVLMRPLLPYALAFAAGAMIFVVVEEVIPEAMSQKSTDLAAMSVMLGFLVMMTLDVALG
ncbi:MAG: ZIP family metal transporter [Thermoplasmatota archaeon]